MVCVCLYGHCIYMRGQISAFVLERTFRALKRFKSIRISDMNHYFLHSILSSIMANMFASRDLSKYTQCIFKRRCINKCRYEILKYHWTMYTCTQSEQQTTATDETKRPNKYWKNNGVKVLIFSILLNCH